MSENLVLTAGEIDQLTSLIERLDRKQVRGRLWHALVNKFTTVPIEMIILNDHGEVLLSYRDDPEFPDCWHHPGSVWNSWETIASRREALVKREVSKLGIEITPPEPIGWLCVYPRDVPHSLFKCSDRAACSLIHLSRLLSGGENLDPAQAKFFPLSKLPENIIDYHRYIIGRVKEYLETGEYIFD